MFSPNSLVHFVFAEENDPFFGADLTKLTLQQHLWLQLHRSGYRSVYFLRPSETDESCSVHTFGDRDAHPYQPEQKSQSVFQKLFSGSKKTELGSWMLKQLRAKSSEASAFVCSLTDFCALFSDDIWADVLEEMAQCDRRTGILVLTAPPIAERSMELLLESPAFNYLHETAVTDLRSGELRSLYDSLHTAKPDSCTFLNVQTPERLQGLLLQLAMEDAQKCVAPDLLKAMAEYLSQWLYHPDLSGTEYLSSALSGPEPTQAVLTEQLARPEVWNRLEKRAADVLQVGSIRRYLQQRGMDSAELPAILLRRAPDSFAGKCLRLRLPPELAADGNAASMLAGVQQSLRAPMNAPENPLLADAVDELVKSCESAAHRHDPDTFRRALEALQTCVRTLYTEPDSQQEIVAADYLDSVRKGLALSDQLFTQKQSLLEMQSMLTNTELAAKTFSQNEAACRTKALVLEKRDDFTRIKALKLVTAGTNDTLETAMQLNQELQQQSVPAAEAQQENVRKSLETETYNLDDLL